jgi:hypothetical protein
MVSLNTSRCSLQQSFIDEIPLFALFPPFTKGDDRGRIPSGCATMSGSFLAGPPREADHGGKGEFFYFNR